MINKIKHWWYTYIKDEPEMSPYYYKKSEISRRVLKRLGIEVGKAYPYMRHIGMYFSVAVDATSGDVIFVMTSDSEVPDDVVRTYIIDVHNFLHIQWDGTKYRQHMIYVPYEYFHEDIDNLVKFDIEMLTGIINYLRTKIEEIKDNYNDERILNWAKYLDEKFDTVDEDSMCYINVPMCHTKEDEIFVQDELIKHGAIPLHQLEVGKTYIGRCRNAREAVWLGDKFEYQRYKFGLTFPEKINHFQNDDGYDVFVPIKVKEEQ